MPLDPGSRTRVSTTEEDTLRRNQDTPLLDSVIVKESFYAIVIQGAFSRNPLGSLLP